MKIKGWTEFQHFKDRTPPWIKLHRTILERRDISVISDCSFRVLVGLWLLASEDATMQGLLPDIPEIAFRLRMEEARIIKALGELGAFLDDVDISVISPRYQDDVPETETETEGEREREIVSGKPDDSAPKKATVNGSRFPEFWAIYPKKVARKTCEGIWKRRKLDALADEILPKLAEQVARDAQWRDGFVPNPQTYLNQDRWEDEIGTPRKANGDKPAAAPPPKLSQRTLE